MLKRSLARTLVTVTTALLPLLPLAAEEGVGFGKALATPRQNAVLSGVVAVTRQMRLQGRTPVVIFDLDATLFDAGCRHKAIFSELARTHRHLYPGMARQVAAWRPEDLPYAVEDMFAQLGLVGPHQHKHAYVFWKKRFFSNEYLRHDRPVCGAVGYVNAVQKAGGLIVYLTGREESQMYPGTVETIRSAGFPLGPGRGELLMSLKSGVRDDQFKGSEKVQQTINALGTVVASFDNEPGNCNALQKSFPEALTVLLDTNHSPKAPPVDAGIPMIGNFRWSWLP
ncbi:MAG: HAD family hydrolase [Candidatus Riflebacteria bacterium]|nr:HAD family hydrolase [Candidatus Riflebacteria bacterium]